MTLDSGNLIDLLQRRAYTQPDQLAYTFVQPAKHARQEVTYSQLDRAARAIAAWLLAEGTEGKGIALAHTNTLEFVKAFVGCIYAGTLAIPIHSPSGSRTAGRFHSILKNSGATLILSDSDSIERSRHASSSLQQTELSWIATDRIPEHWADRWVAPEITAGTPAFLQYTSGSTAVPKGVTVTHGNILHNENLIQSAFRINSSSVVVSWLPPQHDMGLIGGLLQPLYAGVHCVLMSPVSFLESPIAWLQAMSDWKATTSGGPNFAYDLCVRKISAEQKRTLDLSSWVVAFNGSEPILPDTLDRFAAAFASCGFRREAFHPCYGLAEATLIVSGVGTKSSPVVTQVDRRALQLNRVAAATSSLRGVSTLVSSGRICLGQKVSIINPSTLMPCAADQVGEIWVSGPSVASGYWNDPESSRSTFHAFLGSGEGPYLRTGDLGFLDGDDLYVTGRIKDLIIIRGRNFHPSDLELTAAKASSMVQPGCAAAFSILLDGGERPVIVCEISSRGQSDMSDIAESIRSAIADEHELHLHAVILIRSGTIPRTSSGKIQRHACRESYLTGQLHVLKQWVETSPPLIEAGPMVSVDLQSAASTRRWLQLYLSTRLGLREADIDADEPISRYGLDSLEMLELKQKFESQGVTLSLSTLLAFPSISELASTIAERPGEVAPPIAQSSSAWKTELAGDAITSWQQRALWLAHWTSTGRSAYNVSFAVRVHGHLDLSALKRALYLLADRHSILRTSFTKQGDEIEQSIAGEPAPDFEETTIASTSELEAIDYLNELGSRRFDLSKGPPLRVRAVSGTHGELYLSFVAHHIICDFWSFAVFWKELESAYSALASNLAPSLPAEPAEYHEYARRQEEMLGTPLATELRDYWGEQLSHEMPALALPTKRPPSSETSHEGARRILYLNASQMHNLKAVAAEIGTTLFTVLLASYRVLLHRYANQDVVAIGCPAVGRNALEFVGTIGPFVNPLVIRSDMRDDPTFRELVQGTRQLLMEALDHQEYPFGLLTKEFHHLRQAGRTPFFQTMFTFLSSPAGNTRSLNSFLFGRGATRMGFGDCSLEAVPIAKGTAEFEFAVTAGEIDDELAIALDYATELFDESMIMQMLTHWKTLLAGISVNQDARVSALPLLTGKEQYRVLYQWSVSDSPVVEGTSIQAAVELAARSYPDRIAIVGEDEQLSYAELNRRADDLARRLSLTELDQETRIGVCVERSPNETIALLGILKAGGVFVPLDPFLPKERIRAMLDDAEVSVVVTHKMWASIFAKSCELIFLEQPWARSESLSTTSDKTLPDNLAYVLFTSGSTGRPKATMGTQKGILNRCQWMMRELPISPDDVCAHKTSLSFVDAVAEIFAPLCAGARLLIVSEEIVKDPEHLVEALAAWRVTRLLLVPTLLRALMDQTFDLRSCTPALSLWMTSGEELSPDLREQFVGKMGAAVLVNLYGTSEISADATACIVVGDESKGTVPIGRPISNVCAYILGNRMTAVPAGVAGELYIGGACLARGYFGRPDWTAEKFVPNPFGVPAGSRLYRTGDRGRFRSDGQIEFLGREDDQIKLRGFRIEPREIKLALSAHPDVEQAEIIVLDQDAKSQLLAACVICRREVSGTELREHLSALLPKYFIPSRFIFLDFFPLTPSGKVDRLELAALSKKIWSSASRAASTEMERTLSEVWAEILSLEEVDVEESFFNLGGDSIRAMQVISKAKERGIHLTQKLIFERQTISAIATSAAVLQLAPEEKTSASPYMAQAGNGSREFGWSQDDLNEITNAIEALR